MLNLKKSFPPFFRFREHAKQFAAAPHRTVVRAEWRKEAWKPDAVCSGLSFPTYLLQEPIIYLL